MAKIKNEEEAAIYHELSAKYGQSMTMADACMEMRYKQPRTVRNFIPRGWYGTRASLRIRTYAFAQQFAALQEDV